MRKKQPWMFIGAVVAAGGNKATIVAMQENHLDGTDYVYYIDCKTESGKHPERYHPADVQEWTEYIRLAVYAAAYEAVGKYTKEAQMYKAGQVNIIGLFIGTVMKAVPAADPDLVKEQVQKNLECTVIIPY